MNTFAKMRENKIPAMWFALVTMGLVVATLILGILVLGLDEHVLLVCCITITCLSCVVLGYSWDEILNGMIEGLRKAMAALFFFFLIGMAVGAWIDCGTLPALIYYGLNILSPGFFLPATLIITSVISLCTGSGWTTVATVGMVLLGIGTALGISVPLVCGCVVSGSVFGDKMSPLSDTTNLAPAVAGADLFEHISAMLYTTIPVYLICLVIYTVMGLQYAGTAIDQASILEIQNAIISEYDISLVVLIPVIVVLVLSVIKFPAIPALLIGIAVAYPISAIYQGTTLYDFFSVLNYGNYVETGVTIVDDMLTRGGIQEMMWTFSLSVLALALGGIISMSGVLKTIIQKVVDILPSNRFLPACTILTGTAGCACLGDQYMSIVLTGEVYKDVYPEADLEPRMLSRCVEESATITSSLFPWTTCGAYFFAALGVSPFVYAPYAFFNLLTPIVGIILPLTGFGLLTKSKAEAKAKAKLSVK